jgi:hypothetical protein
VTLTSRWVTLRARWVTLRARWVTLRARWVTLRACWVTFTAGNEGSDDGLDMEDIGGAARHLAGAAEDTDGAPARKQMVTDKLRASLTKQGYVGASPPHACSQLCCWVLQPGARTVEGGAAGEGFVRTERSQKDVHGRYSDVKVKRIGRLGLARGGQKFLRFANSYNGGGMGQVQDYWLA